MRKPGAMLAMGAAFTLAATAAYAGPIRPGETSDFSLGLMGPRIPVVLKEAKASPYAPPSAQDCATLEAEIERLNHYLGPDAQQPSQKTTLQKRATKLLGNTVRGFIPHRDVVRFVTGAGKQEKALSDAAMAGWARRGYLRGLQASLACPGSPGLTPDPATTPAAPEPAEAAPADPGLTVASAPAASMPAQTTKIATSTAAPPRLEAIPAAASAPGPVLVRTFVAPAQMAAEATLAR